MKTNEIYAKTMKFNLIKLGLGLLEVLIDAVIMAICIGIGVVAKSETMMVIGFVIGGLIGPGLVHFLIAHYIGYIVKAGHISVITEAVTTGKLPENQIEFAKQTVKERFGTSNVYFAVNSLVNQAVKGLQSGVDTVGGFLEKLPGGSTVISIVKIFISIFLGYVDECCLGYTFYKKDQTAFKSACDGVVIYFQNAKVLALSAIKIVLVVAISSVVLFTIFMFLVAGIMGTFEIGTLALVLGVILTVLLVSSVKTAFIDSYILIKMLQSYMEVAPTTEITVDIYGKLCKISNKFKKLFEKSEKESNKQVQSV